MAEEKKASVALMKFRLYCICLSLSLAPTHSTSQSACRLSAHCTRGAFTGMRVALKRNISANINIFPSVSGPSSVLLLPRNPFLSTFVPCRSLRRGRASRAILGRSSLRRIIQVQPAPSTRRKTTLIAVMAKEKSRELQPQIFLAAKLPKQPLPPAPRTAMAAARTTAQVVMVAVPKVQARLSKALVGLSTIRKTMNTPLMSS